MEDNPKTANKIPGSLSWYPGTSEGVFSSREVPGYPWEAPIFCLFAVFGNLLPEASGHHSGEIWVPLGAQRSGTEEVLQIH
jgi:hypothetical protein